MSEFKLQWKVGEAPTGQYRSFFKRSWPDLYYVDDQGKEYPAAHFIEVNGESYDPRLLKKPDYSYELKVSIAVPTETSFDWKRMKKTWTNLDVAKKEVLKFIKEHPEYHPKAGE